MCHPLSCCHARSASPLALPLHQVVRLLLASEDPEELLSYQATRLHARLTACWHRLVQLVQRTFHLNRLQAQAQVESLLSSLLGERCCRQAVRERVPLAQALGAVATRGSRLRWMAQVRVVGRRKSGWHRG